MVGREFELQLAVLRLIIGGVLDRHPDLKVVMSHLGGGIAATWGRVQRYQDKAFWGLEGDERHGRVPDRPIDEYLSRMFFDTGGFFGAESSIRTALVTIPPERLVLGSDYPQELRSGQDLNALTTVVRGLGDEIAEGLLWRNAQQVLAKAEEKQRP
jgi:predicted TIM-barrel fold metal-dependent hydrolase